ncbi:glycosyltransferase family 4 protein [Neorhodopirellula lusitana]|uniref:glycosyltransferase family 4 protein n=1 Tax=Neorhodopirellula lusitana TaxID=445327 RepID=UPI00384CBB3E
MKIAYISGSYLPSRQANSIHVMRMTAAMAELGHKVVLYAYAGDEQDTTEDLPAFYGVESNVHFQRIAPRDNARGRELKYAWQVRRLVASQKPDLIYGRHLLGLLSCVSLAPTIYETHAARTGINAHLEAWLLRRKNLRSVVAITNALAGDIRARHRLHVPLHVEPDAVTPVDYERIIPASLSGSGQLKVGYCGHLYPGRGGELLVDVARRRPDCDFHLIGGEPTDVDRLRASAVGTTNIFFHGFVAPQEVAAYLAAFDVLVAPYQRRVAVHGGSDTSRWMSPMKLFEYMDAAKPIVISDLPAIAEVVTHDQNALLLQPDDVNAWCQALDRLSDSGIRQRLGENARQLVRQQYTWRLRAERILNRFTTSKGTSL